MGPRLRRRRVRGGARVPRAPRAGARSVEAPQPVGGDLHVVRALPVEPRAPRRHRWRHQLGARQPAPLPLRLSRRARPAGRPRPEGGDRRPPRRRRAGEPVGSGDAARAHRRRSRAAGARRRRLAPRACAEFAADARAPPTAAAARRGLSAMPLQIAFALGTNGERPPEAAEGGGTFGRDKPLLACLQWLRERAAAEGRGPGKEGGEALGYHPGVTCDVTGQCPLIGNRYKLRNENYDLCEDEYVKLPPDEQRRYTKIAPPCFRKPRGCVGRRLAPLVPRPARRHRRQPRRLAGADGRRRRPAEVVGARGGGGPRRREGGRRGAAHRAPPRRARRGAAVRSSRCAPSAAAATRRRRRS